jgi:guanylate kinase
MNIDFTQLHRSPDSQNGGSFAKKIIVITAPSGAGKTSITRYLLEKIPQLSFSISAATRQPRQGEVTGNEYYFLSINEFHRRIKSDEFLEWEMVYEGKYYGTLRSEMERLWNEEKYPLLDIDVQGAIHVNEQYGVNCLSIFIEPPSVQELERRLASRGTESKQELQTRIAKAEYELSFSNQFDEIIVNANLHQACTDTEKLIRNFLKM